MKVGCLFLLIGMGLLGVNAQPAVPIVATADTYLTSCVDPSLHPVLPNLSYGKRSESYSYTGIPACTPTPTGISNTYFVPNITFTWHYYEDYAAQVTANAQCSHNTTTSTLAVRNSQADTLTGSIVDVATGTVVAGAYAGSAFTYTTTSVANAPACSSTIGLEARSGTTTLVIVGGPTCTGVTVQGFCPGLRTTTATVPVTVPTTLPQLGDIDFPALIDVGLKASPGRIPQGKIFP